MKKTRLTETIRRSWRTCRSAGQPDAALKAMLGAYLLLTPLTALADGAAALLLVALFAPGDATGVASGFAATALERLGATGPRALFWTTAAVFAARAALAVAASVLDGAAAARLRRAVQERGFEALMRGRWDALNSGQIGQWGGALTEEAVTFAKYVMSQARALYHLGVCGLIGLLALWLEPAMSLAAAGVTLPLWLGLKALYARQSRLSAEMTEHRQSFAADAVERLSALFQIKAAGEVDQQLEAGRVRQGPMTAVEIKLGWYFGVISAFNLLLVPIILVLFGALAAWRGQTLAAQLQALGSLGLLGYRAMGQLNNLVASIGNLTRLEGCVRPVAELCEIPEEPRRGPLPSALRAVELDDVSYEIGGRKILAGLSLSATAGSLLLVTGPSGGGKTTLANLIAGLAFPSRGEVWYRDAAGERWSSRQRRPRLGYVTQDVFVFRGTVRQNLDPAERLADRELTDSLERAGALAFVRARGGLDAALTEAGRTLSGGERRRLAIAHALAQRSECLILDEVTNGLDEAVKRELVETIDRLARETIVVAITHDLEAFAGTNASRVDLAAAGRNG